MVKRAIKDTFFMVPAFLYLFVVSSVYGALHAQKGQLAPEGFIPEQIGPMQPTHVISLFFRMPNQDLQIQFDPETFKELIAHPGSAELASLRQRNVLETVSGIPVIYMLGKISVSNVHGQVLFPRLSTNNTLIIIVTRHRPSPVIKSGNTVVEWHLKAGKEATWYELTKVTEGKNTYWNIRIIPHPDTKIPDDTLIICAEPHNIKIPLGSWPTNNSENLILPDALVTGETHRDTIGVSRFFAPVNLWFAYAAERFAVTTS